MLARRCESGQCSWHWKGQSLYEHLTSRPLYLFRHAKLNAIYQVKHNMTLLCQVKLTSQHISRTPLLPAVVCRSVAVSPKSSPLQTSHRFNYTREEICFWHFFLQIWKVEGLIEFVWMMRIPWWSFPCVAAQMFLPLTHCCAAMSWGAHSPTYPTRTSRAGSNMLGIVVVCNEHWVKYSAALLCCNYGEVIHLRWALRMRLLFWLDFNNISIP